MEKAIDLLQEFLNALPPGLKWLVPVLPLVAAPLWLVYRYVFDAKPLNLLTVGEHRRRHKIEFIERCLESKHNDDPELAAVLKEEWRRLVFQEVTKIKAKEPMRRQLTLLYEQTPRFVQWTYIKSAYYSLNEKDGRLIKGVSRADAVFGILFTILGSSMALIGIFLLVYSLLLKDRVPADSLKLGLGAAFAYFFTGLWLLVPAFPARRAWLLQKYIPVRARDGEEGGSEESAMGKVADAGKGCERKK